MNSDPKPTTSSRKRILGGALAAAVLLCVPVLAIAVLGLTPMFSAPASAQPVGEAALMPEAPADANAPTTVENGETILKDWTYTRRPYSGYRGRGHR